jgi:hypothetical protein
MLEEVAAMEKTQSSNWAPHIIFGDDAEDPSTAQK